MPKTTRSGRPKESELPATLRRSSRAAQETFAKAHDSAYEEYGSESRAHRVAYSALKRTFQKVGDRWEQKASSGPSDERSATGRGPQEGTAGGVNAEATKDELYTQAQRLGIPGRSRMTKAELVHALEKESRRRTSG